MLDILLQGFAEILHPITLMYLAGGVIVGLVLGAIPGLSATMAIALVIPMTLYMPATQAITMLLGAYNGGIFGGSISAILLGTPGTSAAVATAIDGFKLTQQGKAIKAIKIALTASVTGGLFAAMILIFVAEPIAKIALKFGPPEYAMIMLFSLTIIGNAASKSFIKGMIGGVLGLLIATIGLDPLGTTGRFVFRKPFLTGGIDVIVMLIGLLAVAEIIKQAENITIDREKAKLIKSNNPDDERLTFKEYRSCFKTIIRSSAIGTGIGALPGIGPTIAAYLGYDFAKRGSKHPEMFGTGIIEGVAAPEAANNAVCGSNLIPLLAFGVPGDVVAAILIGAFMMQGISPGPLIFQEAPELAYGIYAALIVSNLMLLTMGWFSAKYFSKILNFKMSTIFPIVLVFCAAGSYAIRQDMNDIWVMFIFGILGYVMMRFEFSPTTLLIGFILGPLFEVNFRQSMMISNGSLNIFIRSPICIFFIIITTISIIFIVRNEMRRKNI